MRFDTIMPTMSEKMFPQVSDAWISSFVKADADSEHIHFIVLTMLSNCWLMASTWLWSVWPAAVCCIRAEKESMWDSIT